MIEPIPAWKDMNAGQKLARVGKFTDEICRALRVFNNPAYNVGDYNQLASIVFRAIEDAHHTQR